MLNTTNLTKNSSTPELRLSFSGAFFVWSYFLLLFGSTFYLLALIFFPFSESHLNHLEVIIFRSLFLLIAPIFTFPIFIAMLPFQRINFNARALLSSFIHKLFFILMTPLLYIGYLLIDYYLRLVPALYFKDFRTFTTDLLVWLLVIPWSFLTLYIYELVMGKNTSQFLKIKRLREQNRPLSYSVNTNQNVQSIELTKKEKVHNDTKFSSQWSAVTMNIFFISICTATILLPIFGNFVFGLIIFLGINLSVLCISINFYKYFLLKKGFTFNRLTKIYHIIFGSNDIPVNVSTTGFMVNFFNFAIFVSFYNLSLGTGLLNILFLIYYVIIIVIFVGTVWSYQLKTIIPKRIINVNQNIKTNWISKPNYPTDHKVHFCNTCGIKLNNQENYCPNCGKKIINY